MPFEQAAALLTGLMGVAVSQSRGHRCTQAAEKAYVKLQIEAADRIERETPELLPGCEQLVVNADGATPYLRWVQVWSPCCRVNGPKSKPWPLERSKRSDPAGPRGTGQIDLILFQAGGRPSL